VSGEGLPPLSPRSPQTAQHTPQREEGGKRGRGEERGRGKGGHDEVSGTVKHGSQVGLALLKHTRGPRGTRGKGGGAKGGTRSRNLGLSYCHERPHGTGAP